MQCFQCDQEATAECPRCGAVYCDEHGDALCAQCMDPALALPSYRVYRGSLVALLVGSVFAVWLLVLPPAGADQDGPPAPLAGINEEPTVTATATPEATATATATPGATSTAEATSTATPEPTEEPTETPEPEPEFTEYTIVGGDTLLGIAQRFLPEGRTVEGFADEIAEVNGISDPTQIAIGDVLQIPTE